ncbi:hypothetical protein VHA01S_014_00730 [Vibrio halioticoli NBRC 102217]|uniref:DUF2956 domain-containing protein n=2 Tax=Vibrionaceae TaxID=641 RepID=V5FCA0_9VIBR|nr:hypothetical protein VHA01S_014_00730 [Vibrio halioticoli NBRC 102217]
MQVAKATQKPGQTKEQTKLIAQGIEKGIAEYKKRQKQKSRDADKLKKQNLKKKQQQLSTPDNTPSAQDNVSTAKSNRLPWVLLVISWVGFIAYTLLTSH